MVDKRNYSDELSSKLRNRVKAEWRHRWLPHQAISASKAFTYFFFSINYEIFLY